MFRSLDPAPGRAAPSGGPERRHRPRREGHRGRVRRTLLALVALLGSFGLTAVVSAPTAQAATVSANIQLRGVAGNCLTAEAVGNLSFVTMRTCGSVPASRQNWNIINWESDASFNRRGLALSGDTSLCLGTAGNSTSAGSRTLLQACDPSVNPSIQWRADDLLVGPPRGIRDLRSNRCLDVQFVGTGQGTPVWLWDCNNDSNAEIWLIGRPDYTGRILGHGNQCLSAPSSVPANGDLLRMQPCTGGGEQRWVRINGVLMLGGRCLEVKDSSLASPTPAQMWTCLNLDRQQWSQLANGSLKNKLPTRCLDVAYAGTAPGTQAWIWDCNASYAQGWYLNALPGEFMVTQSSATQLNAAILSRLADCGGMISFSRNNVNIVVMKKPAPFLVRRSDGGYFSDAARTAASTWRNRAVINGQFYSPRGSDFALIPQGDIYTNGNRVNRNPYWDKYEGFYVAASQTGACLADWRIGPQTTNAFGGAPPVGTNFAMGGARPLIIAGERWGTPAEGYLRWHPNAGNQFEHYNSDTQGKPTIGVRGDGIVMLLVQGDLVWPINGRTLSQIRDAYFMLGFKDAVMFDASTSTTLFVNGVEKVAPWDLGPKEKDADIPTGLAIATG